MKNRFLLLLAPIFLLASCSGEAFEQKAPEQEKEEFTPVVTTTLSSTPNRLGSGDHITYLMMSRYGYILSGGVETKPEKNVEGTYYEYCIKYSSEAGGNLPSASEVKSTVEGATFRGWAYYTDNVYPEYLTKVPSKSGECVYAIFDGTITSGGGDGSSSGGGGSSGGQTTDNKYGIIKEGTPIAATYKGEQYGKQEYVLYNVSFNVGEKFALYDYANQTGWVVDLNAYSFGDNDGTNTKWKEYVSKAEKEYTVLKSFVGDLYIQLQYQNDTLYIGLSA